MIKQYPKPKSFDGGKFTARYNLGEFDFWADKDFIYLRDGLVLPDDPPIFEAPDPPKPDPRPALRAKPDATPVTIKDLKDLEII